MKTWQLLLTVFLSAFCFGCSCNAQTVDEPDYLYIDEDALTQRVDDLTSVVNTHTDQIEQLAKQLDAKSSLLFKLNDDVNKLKEQSLATVGTKRTSLGTELKKLKPLALGSVGSSMQVSTVSYGSVGTAPVIVASPPIMYSPPMVQAAPNQVMRTRSFQSSSPRLGSRLGGFFTGNRSCPPGGCPE